jgi:hypothetical protein
VEKYAVPTSDDPKLASDETESVCPNCGAKLEDTDEVNVRKCPGCGTLPFEGAEGSDASQG